ncbi:MAG: 4-hydroxy-tetrahydrodipicolinate synthase [Clostridia bacterium]|nr:4-hydroxy-tetrahydrodipicolinate synthase [Clostridia bacterium]
MSNQPIFTGAAVAIITPMYEDGTVNYDEFRRIVDDQIEKGTDAIVACGTTGESSTLTDDEHIEVIRVAVEQANGRVPVIAGTGSNDTAYCIMLSKEAEKVGADALLLVSPYYNKTSQRGLIAHYKAVAEAVNLPIILYNVPSRTGMNIQPDTVVELSKIPNIVAIKQASGDFSATARIAAECDIDIYSGNDDQIVPILALGGKGVISVLSNVAPAETHEMCRKWFDGDVQGSIEMQLKYLELANAMFCDVNPIPVKEAMNMLGWNAGPCRMPLYPMDDANNKKVADTLRKYGLIK